MPVSKKCLATVSGLFSRTIGKPIPQENLDAWKMVLDPLSDEMLLEAAMEVVRTQTATFDVAPGAVFQAAMRLAQRKAGPHEGEAWQLIRDCVCGRAKRSDLPAVVCKAADQIGWEQLREMKIDDQWTRKLFLEFYREDCEAAARTALEAISNGRSLEALTDGQRPALQPIDEADDGEVIPITGLAGTIRQMAEETFKPVPSVFGMEPGDAARYEARTRGEREA